jgi:hypothetical protein
VLLRFPAHLSELSGARRNRERRQSGFMPVTAAVGSVRSFACFFRSLKTIIRTALMSRKMDFSTAHFEFHGTLNLAASSLGLW